MRRKWTKFLFRLISFATIIGTSTLIVLNTGASPMSGTDVSTSTYVRATRLSDVTNDREPSWRLSLLGQQKRKRVLVSKMRKENVRWKRIGRNWGNHLPNRDCNSTSFINNATKSMPGGEIYGRRVALASFPGSGNTWLRHLFHVTTGIWTGSVYFDPKLYHGGFPGEACSCNDSMTFGIKVHDVEHARAVGCSFDDVIFVLRNPYNSILSEFNRRKGQSHTGMADYDDFDSKDWSSYASKKVYQFQSLMPGWFDLCHTFSQLGNPSCLIINYEELKGNPQREMRRVLTQLGIPLGRLKCLDDPESASGPFYRKHDVTKDEAKKTNDVTPMCKLDKSVRNMLYDVIKNASTIVRGFKHGESHVRELLHDLPNC